MSYSTKTMLTSSSTVGGGGARSSSGGGGGGSRKGTSAVMSSVGNFSCKSYGGGSKCGYGGGGGGGGFGGRLVSCGGYGGGFGSMYGGFSGGGYGGGGVCGGGFGGAALGAGGVCGGGFGGGVLGAGGVCGGGFAGSGGFGGSSGFGVDDGILSTNEKITMQNLNDRLATYLDKVRDLEESNADLEKLIKEWYLKQGPTASLKDYTPYLKEIDDIGKEIVAASVEYNKVAVDVDNTKMTIDDFRTKAEHEMALRQNVEADINGLRPLLDQLTISKSDLEMEYESLKEELISLIKNHEEEIKGLINQTTGDVNVEVNAAPGCNLTEVLEDMRKEYDTMIARNHKEVEQWYAAKIAEVNQEVSTSGQDIEINSKQITELRREFQNVEIELQSQLSMLQSLQTSLDDTECRYNMQLQQMQSVIGSVEEELANIRCEIENQSQEYKMLLGIKMQLEQEIAQYRSLLDSGSKDIGAPEVGGVRGGVNRGGGNRGRDGGVPTLPRGGDRGGDVVRVGGGGGVRVGGESNRTEGGSVVRGEGSTGGRGDERRPSKSGESFVYSRRSFE